jgi:hypothetical protein
MARRRANGEGSVWRRKDARWEGRVRQRFCRVDRQSRRESLAESSPRRSTATAQWGHRRASRSIRSQHSGHRGPPGPAAASARRASGPKATPAASQRSMLLRLDSAAWAHARAQKSQASGPQSTAYRSSGVRISVIGSRLLRERLERQGREFSARAAPRVGKSLHCDAEGEWGFLAEWRAS